MNQPQTLRYKHRGTIFLDNCSLKRLSVLIDDSFINPDVSKGKRSYLDALSLLANNGYRILIPEMVAIEASMTNPYHNDKYSPSIRRRFIEKASAGSLPNIVVVKNTGPEAVDQLCQYWHDFPAHNEKEYNKKIQIFKEMIKSQGLGDKAILSLVDTYHGRRRGTADLLIMTEDNPLRRSIPHQDIHSLDARRLCHYLEASGLLTHLGVRSGITAERLFKDIYQKHKGIKPGEEPLGSPIDPEVSERYVHLFRWNQKLMASLKEIQQSLKPKLSASDIIPLSTSMPDTLITATQRDTNQSSLGLITQRDALLARYGTTDPSDEQLARQ